MIAKINHYYLAHIVDGGALRPVKVTGERRFGEGTWAARATYYVPVTDCISHKEHNIRELDIVKESTKTEIAQLTGLSVNFIA
jgi:hypothetical protein